ncbi:hypothetical protein [Saccharothrix deserti]|uniref:hypothetical protein n=1 Tax=Saccharothrix deserti TaxID=2593674 RepID=UPI00131EB1D5|nr:hypothetical protein [Saccharothrix deserti]
MVAVLVAAACAFAAPGAASADQRTSVAAASARANGTAVFDADGVRIRETPRLNGHVNGYGNNGQGADVWCARDGDVVNGVATWYRLTNRETGVTGWVHYDLLREVFWTNPTGGCGSREGGTA